MALLPIYLKSTKSDRNFRNLRHLHHDFILDGDSDFDHVLMNVEVSFLINVYLKSDLKNF